MRKPGHARELSDSPGIRWRIVRLFAVLSLLTMLFVLLARTWWWFELFTHFRVQLLCLQLIVLAALLSMRKMLWAFAIGAACIGNGIGIRDYLLPGAAGAATSESSAHVRILSANVLADNDDPTRFVELILAERPDVFAVIEFTELFAERLRAVHDEYPFTIRSAEPGNFGIAVYSRWPIAQEVMLDLRGFAAIDALIDSPFGTWHFVAAHPVPPMGAQSAAIRNGQLVELAEHVASLESPVVIAGDFNLTPFSPWFEDFTERTQTSDALRGRGPGMTWPSFLAALGIPIDHVFVSREFAVLNYRRANDIGSDHLPIVAELNRREIPLD